MTLTSTDTLCRVDDMDVAPHAIFRWEAASGLEHTCYACTTKMNNPKARQTCYGVHSIPCFRYHQTMHAIGTSHNCFACIQADNLHEIRHRKIAELVTEYKALDEEETASSVKNKKAQSMNLPLRERDANTPLPITTPTGANRLRRQSAVAPLVIRASTESNEHADNQEEVENEEVHTQDTASTTTSSTSPNNMSGTIPKLTKADVRNAKRAAKSAKSQRKSVKNQTRLAHTVAVKQTDVARVGIILHGEHGYFSTTTANGNICGDETGEAGSGDNAPCRHPLASDKSIEDVIERNRRYVSNIHEHKAALLREIGGRRKIERRERVKKVQAQQYKDVVGKRGRGRLFEDDNNNNNNDEDAVATGGNEDDGMLIDAILAKLGIVTPSTTAASFSENVPRTPITNKRLSSTSASLSSPSSCHSHGKLAVLAQLRVAISEDLQKHENEQRQTCIRAGGFWRYVGRQVFDRMCEISETIDWRTGAIKREDEKEGGEVAGEGEDGDGDAKEEEECQGEADCAAGEEEGANENGDEAERNGNGNGNPWEGRKDVRGL